jgi:uncharacterized protein (TIGR03435 family)
MHRIPGKPGICLMLCVVAAAGQVFAPTGSMTFEAASIKRSPPDAQQGAIRPAPGGRRYIGSGGRLRAYLWLAYQVRPDQIVGGPSWIDTDLYDLNAEAERPSSLDDLHIMLQNLLTERFKLQFHHKVREQSVYLLTVDKGGTKNLKLHSDASAGDVHLDVKEEQFLHQKWTVHCASLSFFTSALASLINGPVLNQTNLDGCFDFELAFTRDLPQGLQEGQLVNGSAIDASGPSIFQALTKQVGLRLAAGKGSVDTIVIDHAQRPSDE